MSNDIANRGEILLYDITISILETVRQDTMYISEFDRQTERYLKGNNHEPFELNKALFEAVTACFAECHIDDPRPPKPQNRMDAIHIISLTGKGATP